MYVVSTLDCAAGTPNYANHGERSPRFPPRPTRPAAYQSILVVVRVAIAYVLPIELVMAANEASGLRVKAGAGQGGLSFTLICLERSIQGSMSLSSGRSGR